jgi:hypothetical protein
MGLSGKHVGTVDSNERALALNPQDAKAHNNLGLLRQAKGNYDNAILHFTSATRCDPADSPTNPDFIAEGNTNLALCIAEKELPPSERGKKLTKFVVGEKVIVKQRNGLKTMCLVRKVNADETYNVSLPNGGRQTGLPESDLHKKTKLRRRKKQEENKADDNQSDESEEEGFVEMTESVSRKKPTAKKAPQGSTYVPKPTPLTEIGKRYSDKQVSALRGLDSSIRHILKLSAHRNAFAEEGINPPLFDKRCAQQYVVHPSRKLDTSVGSTLGSTARSTKSAPDWGSTDVLPTKSLPDMSMSLNTTTDFDFDTTTAKTTELLGTWAEAEGLNFECEPEVQDIEAEGIAEAWARMRARQ